MKLKVSIYFFSAFIAIFIAFLAFDSEKMRLLYDDTIFWFLTLSCFLWIVSVLKSLDTCEKDSLDVIFSGFFQQVKTFCINHWLAVFLSIIIMTFGTMVFKQDYRVLGDETVLLLESQSLYETKKSSVNTVVMYRNDGGKDILGQHPSKRPALFVYLVSLLHSLTGYRETNPFVLNYILGCLSLFLFYYLIYILFDKFWGINALICLAAYPIFIIYVNTAGFDIFNLMCSLVFLICVYKFIKNPDAIRAEILLFWLPLISQSRYESIISLFIGMGIVFSLLPRKEYSLLSYRLVFFPFLFVPPAWLRLTTNDASEWQVENMEAAFSINNLVMNLKQAFIYSLSNDKAYGIVPIITILGLIGLIFLIIYILFKKSFPSLFVFSDNIRSNFSFNLFMNSLLSFYLLHGIIKFSYKLSDLIWDVYARRHCLVFIPFFIMMAIYFIVVCCHKFNFKRINISIITCFLLLAHWSGSVDANCGVNDMPAFLELKYTKRFLQENYPNKREYSLISQKPSFYVPFGYSSLNFNSFNNDAYKDIVMSYYYDKTINYFLVIQYIDPKNKMAHKGNEMPKNLEGEIVYENLFNGDICLRISKCVPKKI